MKEFLVYWSILLLSLLLFSVNVYLLLFSYSIVYLISTILTLLWVGEGIIFIIIVAGIWDGVESVKISKWLYSSGCVLLGAGIMAIALIDGGKEKNSDIPMVFSIFSLCYYVLSMFFYSIIKNIQIEGGITDDRR